MNLIGTAILSCLKKLLERDSWVRYGHLILEIKTLTKEQQAVLYSLDKYYKTYPSVTNVTIDDIKTFYSVNYPHHQYKEEVITLLDEVRLLDVSNEQILDQAVGHIVDHAFTSRVVSELLPVLNGDAHGGMARIGPVVEQYNKIVSPLGTGTVGDVNHPSFHDLLTDIQSDGLMWPLAPLNEKIGRVFPGTLGHVFAPTDTGKTAFFVHMAAFFAAQMKGSGTVLYLNNEENSKRTLARLYCSMLNTPMEQLLDQDPQTVSDKFHNKGGRYIRFVDGIHFIQQVEQNISTHHPRVVIVDQGPKVGVVGDYPQHQQRQIVYNKYRQLADKYDVIFLSAGQADSGAHGKKWLDFSHIDGSKVGLPGECDYIIGISKDFDTDSDVRYFTISKNKLQGKLGRFVAQLHREVSRYSTNTGAPQ